ncbi:MAG: zinc ribbon domain-containing protein [bacterium]
MPIYEYECGACGDEHEVIQAMSAGALRKCPSCGRLKLRRKISRSAFHLKGEGWYVTDYKANGKDPKAEEAAGDAKSDSKSDSKTETKTETKSESKSGGDTKNTETKKKEKAKSTD